MWVGLLVRAPQLFLYNMSWGEKNFIELERNITSLKFSVEVQNCLLYVQAVLSNFYVVICYIKMDKTSNQIYLLVKLLFPPP